MTLRSGASGPQCLCFFFLRRLFFVLAVALLRPAVMSWLAAYGMMRLPCGKTFNRLKACTLRRAC